ncbi:MAG: phosphopantetheine-binding protein [Sphingomonadaceae bacterium]
MGGNSHKMGANHSDTAHRLRQTLRDALSLKNSVELEAETPLFGALPELDSMAVATLLTEIEDRFGIVIDDDDVDGDTFETFGALTAFVEDKLAARRP